MFTLNLWLPRCDTPSGQACQPLCARGKLLKIVDPQGCQRQARLLKQAAPLVPPRSLRRAFRHPPPPFH
jgi:hypothetical protein